jgi:hypothetical protein
MILINNFIRNLYLKIYPELNQIQFYQRQQVIQKAKETTNFDLFEKTGIVVATAFGAYFVNLLLKDFTFSNIFTRFLFNLFLAAIILTPIVVPFYIRRIHRGIINQIKK